MLAANMPIESQVLWNLGACYRWLNEPKLRFKILIPSHLCMCVFGCVFVFVFLISKYMCIYIQKKEGDL